jgi:hypothetical protein
MKRKQSDPFLGRSFNMVKAEALMESVGPIFSLGNTLALHSDAKAIEGTLPFSDYVTAMNAWDFQFSANDFGELVPFCKATQRKMAPVAFAAAYVKDGRSITKHGRPVSTLAAKPELYIITHRAPSAAMGRPVWTVQHALSQAQERWTMARINRNGPRTAAQGPLPPHLDLGHHWRATLRHVLRQTARGAEWDLLTGDLDIIPTAYTPRA